MIFYFAGKRREEYPPRRGQMSVPPEQPPVPPPGNPVDQPTAPLHQVPEPAGAYRADPYVADPRPTLWQLEGLRTALTVVGLIALIAIGLAVWALIRSEQNHRAAANAPASTAGMVASLTRRVDRLEANVRALNSSGGGQGATARSLAARIAAIQQSEKRLSTQVSHAGNASQTSQLSAKEAALSAKVSQITGKEAALSGQLSQLQGRVSSLAAQVAQLKGRTTTQTTGTGASTTP